MEPLITLYVDLKETYKKMRQKEIAQLQDLFKDVVLKDSDLREGVTVALLDNSDIKPRVYGSVPIATGYRKQYVLDLFYCLPCSCYVPSMDAHRGYSRPPAQVIATALSLPLLSISGISPRYFRDIIDSDYEFIFYKEPILIHLPSKQKTISVRRIEVILGQKIYSLLAKYITFLSKSEVKSSYPKLYEADRCVVHLNGSEKWIPIEPAKTLAEKILNTPDNTDNLLPKVDFSISTCLLLFDKDICFEQLAENLLKVATNTEKDGYFHAAGFVFSIGISKTDFKRDDNLSYYTIKTSDGICVVKLEELSGTIRDKTYKATNSEIYCVVSPPAKLKKQ